MGPEEAFEREIANYRAMTGEERLGIALAMHEMACDRARREIRQRHPGANEQEVERMLRQRIALAMETGQEL